MRRAAVLGLLVLGLVGCGGRQALAPPRGGPSLDAYLRPKIRQHGDQLVIAVGGAQLGVAPGLGEFYARHGDHLVWSTPRGPLPVAGALLRLLRQPEEQGLPRQAYHLPELEGAWAGWSRGPGSRRALVRLAELDLLLTNAFLVRAQQLQGLVPPAHREWQPESFADPAALLDSALAHGSVEGVLDGLVPAHPEYRRLGQALAAYQRIAAGGGWQPLPEGEGPRRGRQGPAEEALRRRLAAAGDLDTLDQGEGFDAAVERALQRFQARHGLAATGRADRATLAALDVPVSQRIQQLEWNLERWRWLPLGREARYLLVRLDDFTLELVEGGEVVLEMKVVTGKAQWRTPIFRANMTQLVLNPYWNVPATIAREEVLPALRQNPDYLEERGFLVVSGTGDQARVLPADSLEVDAWSDEDWPYTFIQLPGPDNPLGRIKFLLPNPHNVYLHDTPNRELFSRAVRDFSHGCIRLEKSLELAVALLAGDPEWDRAELRRAVQAGETRQLRLPRPIPVFFGYWTARADQEGRTRFAPDLYGADARLEGVWPE